MMRTDRFYSILGLAIFFGAWWLWSGSVLLPDLASILDQFGRLILKGRLLADVIASFGRVLAGLAIAISLGLALTLLTILCRPAGYAIYGITEMLRPVPPIAWTPIAISFAGIGNAPAIAVVALGAFAQIWFALIHAIDEVQWQHIWAARSFGATKAALIRHVYVPSMLPRFLAGLRLGVGIGWFSVVAAEMMGISSGLGHGVLLYSLNIEMEAVYAYVLTIGAIGFVANSVVLHASEALIKHTRHVQ